MKYSLGISNFLEEISSLSHSIVFLYFFALITEEGFLISPFYSFKLCTQMAYFSFSPLLFTSLLFTAICKASSDSHFAFLHFFFFEMVLIPVSCTVSWTSVHSSSGTLFIRSSPLNLFLTSTAPLLTHTNSLHETQHGPQVCFIFSRTEILTSSSTTLNHTFHKKVHFSASSFLFSLTIALPSTSHFIDKA